MIIDSDFVDYYDSYSNKVMDIDPGVIYKRGSGQKARIDFLQLCFLNSYMRERRANGRFVIHTSGEGDWRSDSRIAEVELFMILLCGKMYPFAHVRLSSRCHRKELDYEGKHEDFFDYREPYKLFDNDKIKESYKKWLRSWGKDPQAQFGEAEPRVLQLNRLLGPVLLVTNPDKEHPRIDTAPCLSRYAFPLSVHDVSMEIRQFLTVQDPEIVEVADKYKVLGHGYDDMSFRREKGGPTRKRRKQTPE